MRENNYIRIQRMIDDLVYNIDFLYPGLILTRKEEVLNSDDLLKIQSMMDDLYRRIELLAKETIVQSEPDLVEEEEMPGELIPEECVTPEQLEELNYELTDWPRLTEDVLKKLKITQLSQMPKKKYHESMRSIRRIKSITIASNERELFNGK